MDIANHVKAAHQRLAQTGAQFLEFTETNPAACKRSSFNVLEGSDAVGILQSWPVFINRHTQSEFEVAATHVFSLIKSIPKRLFANDPVQISHFFGTPVDIVKMQLDGTDDRHLDNLLARGDFIFSPSGLKCLEYNVSANIGGLQVAFWEQMYVGIPLIAKFIKENQVKITGRNVLAALTGHFLERAADMFAGPDGEINMALVIPRYIDGAMATENIYLDRLFKSIIRTRYNLTGKVVFCDYHHLNTNNGKLLYHGKRIHILMEMYHGVMPDEIFQLFKKGALHLYNGPVTKLLSNKLTLAALSMHRDSDCFSAPERAVIEKYIPWTRKMVPGETTFYNSRVRLEDFIITNREQLVIKPPLGNSGAGVYIGKNTPPLLWEKVVATAFKEKNHLVQERIDSQRYLFQHGEEGYCEHIVTWGLFVFGSVYGGGWVRALPAHNKSGIINSIQGAEETVALVVEE